MCEQDCQWLLGIAGWLAFVVVFLFLLLFTLCVSLIALYRDRKLNRLRQRQLSEFRLEKKAESTRPEKTA